MNIKQTKFKGLIDTGASISCVSQALINKTLKLTTNKYNPSKIKFVAGVGGEILPVLGVVQVPIQIQGETFISQMHVFQKLHHNPILGKDFLTNIKANIDFDTKTVELDGNVKTSCFEKDIPPDIARNAHAIHIPPQSGMYIPVSVSNFTQPS